MWTTFIIALTLSVSHAAPSTGKCMCVTGTVVNVRDEAGLSSHVVASVTEGECYQFNGGVLTKDGKLWYELQNVYGHHRVWAASNYLNASSSMSCYDASGRSTLSRFAPGIVSVACLHCICMQESGCRAIGCHQDVGSLSCGYFQIKLAYWKDCGSPGSSWQLCANDLYCSSKCVQNYMNRYAQRNKCPMTCEGFAREHNGGPMGCHRSSTLSYWHRVQSQKGCKHVH